MEKNVKRWGSILNIIFLTNWIIFLVIIVYIYKNVYKNNAYFPQWLTIICWLLPFTLLLLLSFYITMAYFTIKHYEKEQQKQSWKYLSCITILATSEILSSLLILIAKNNENTILAIALYLSLSFIFAIATLTIDALFFMKRLKWKSFMSNEKKYFLVKNEEEGKTN